MDGKGFLARRAAQSEVRGDHDQCHHDCYLGRDPAITRARYGRSFVKSPDYNTSRM